MINSEKEEIKNLVEEAYIQGIHETQDEATVRKGFHEDFTMLVLWDGRMQKVQLDEWFERVEKLKEENPEMWSQKTRSVWHFIDIAGNAASIKLDVFKGNKYFSTDFMFLYKFENGWKIVSKVFSF